MVNGLIISGVFFIMGIIIALPLSDSINEKIKSTIIIFITSVLIGFSHVATLKLEEKQNLELWNNGIRTNCSGEYYFTNSYKNRYTYCCNKCGKVIDLKYNFIKER